MKHLKLFEDFENSTAVTYAADQNNEHDPTWTEGWEKFLPESFTIIKGNEKFTRYKGNIMQHADMIQMMYEPKSEPWGQPDDLEFDLYVVQSGQDIRINVDITFGDLVTSEFSIESPNKVKVIEYTSFDAKFDPSNTAFAFTEESLQNLIAFFNKLDTRFELTRDKFNFLDDNPYSYQPD